MELFHVIVGGSQESECIMSDTPLSFFESRYKRPLIRLVDAGEIDKDFAEVVTQYLGNVLPFHVTDPLVYSTRGTVKILWIVSGDVRIEAEFDPIFL